MVGRPSRARRAPVAADGTVLAVPKVRKYKKRKNKREQSASSDDSSDLSSAESEHAEESSEEEVVEVVEKPRVAPPATLPKGTPSKKRKEEIPRKVDPVAVTTQKKVREESSDDDLDVDMPMAGPSTRRQAPASKPKRVIDSPLAALPASIREEYLPKAKNRMLSIFAGNPPPPGHDENGKPDGSECVGLEEQWRSMYSVVHGTLHGEGNSALLVGGRGTGKNLLLQSVLRTLADEEPRSSTGKQPYHIVYLDGAKQPTDRTSLRELARQLVKAGAIRQPKVEEEEAMGLAPEPDTSNEIFGDDEILDADNSIATEKALEQVGEDDDDTDAAALNSVVFSSLANTTSTILTLLSSEQASLRSSLPLIIVLSSFDLYTSRPRQALLYVLLDAVQAGSYTPGLCVLGMTSRLDTTELLEKRVRSRFSGRTINTWSTEPWPTMLQHIFRLGIHDETNAEARTFNEAWKKEAEQIADDSQISDCLTLWESMGNEIRTLYCRLFPIVASIRPIEQPSMHAALVEACEEMTTPQPTILDELTTPEFALLIAAKQLLARDREVFNFVMCFEEVQRFVRRTESDRVGVGSMFGDMRRYEEAPANSTPPGRRITASNVNIAQHGLMNRQKVLSAFRSLLALELFQPELVLNSLSHTAATSGTGVGAATAARRAAQVAKTDYIRVKCTIFPQTIVEAAKSKTRREALSVNMVQWATTTI